MNPRCRDRPLAADACLRVILVHDLGKKHIRPQHDSTNRCPKQGHHDEGGGEATSSNGRGEDGGDTHRGQHRRARAHVPDDYLPQQDRHTRRGEQRQQNLRELLLTDACRT